MQWQVIVQQIYVNLSKKMDYPTNNQPSYFRLFGETTRRFHLDQPVSIIATSSKRFAVEKTKGGKGHAHSSGPSQKLPLV